MPYSVTVTDQDYKPISATVYYVDFEGIPIGSQGIPVTGANLDESLIDRAFTVTFKKEGYYDFDTGAFALPAGSTAITLEKKPVNTLVAYGIGAVIGYFLAKFLKF